MSHGDESLEPLLERIQGDMFLAAVLLPGLGRFVPGGKLLLCVFSRFDPGKVAFVLPAELLEYLVDPAALRPLLDRGGAAAELSGRAGTAAILRRDPSGDGEVSPAVSTAPNRNVPSDAFSEREVYQVPDCVGV